MLLIHAIKERFAFKTRQSHEFGSMVQPRQHYSSHSINMEERKHAYIDFLKGICHVT